MKWTFFIAALWAGSGHADSLCGVTAQEALPQIIGAWTYEGAVSVETETLSIVEPDTGRAIVGGDGSFAAPPVSRWIAAPVDLRGEVVYDVDQVDDLLETVEAAWIADAVSLTPCGPEGLPQLTAEFMNEELTGQVTLLPYFTDLSVMIVEAELRGEWGLAFITTAALMTRQ